MRLLITDIKMKAFRKHPIRIGCLLFNDARLDKMEPKLTNHARMTLTSQTIMNEQRLDSMKTGIIITIGSQIPLFPIAGHFSLF